jgi:hypothetical protein
MDTNCPDFVKRALKAFCLIFGILLVTLFALDYFRRYGFSIEPFLHERQTLWSLLNDAAIGAFGGGLTAGTIVYFAGREKKVMK